MHKLMYHAKMSSLILPIITIILSLLPVAVFADDQADFLARLNMDAFQGSFEQSVSNEKGQVLERNQGILRVLKPSYFDWQITAPYVQRIVNDGQMIWSYDVDFAQITQFRADQSLQGTPVQLLTGDPQALRSYQIRAVACDMHCFELLPLKEDAPFQRLQFTFDKQGLLAIEMIDSLNQKSHLQFIQRNVAPHLQRADFQFSPPKGVDIIPAQSW